MSGFIARAGHCAGVASPLYVRALVLRHAETACAIVQADVLGFTASQVTEIREFAAASLGLRRHNVLISATHTHSGPAIFPIRGACLASPGYQRFVIEQIQLALADASEHCQPARLSTGSFPLEFGVNRRQDTPDGTILGVSENKPRPQGGTIARFETRDSTTLLFSYACHPYILGPENLLASGDFPAFAADELEAEPDTTALFLNGCAGNIAPRAAFEGMGSARAEGSRLAAVVDIARGSLTPQSVQSLKSDHCIVRLPYKPLPTETEIAVLMVAPHKAVRSTEKEKTGVKQRIAAAMEDWGAEILDIVRRRKPLPPVHCEVQALRVGPLVFLGISGEPFFELGEGIRARADCGEVWPLGYTNAFCGYIPLASEIAGGGYEVDEAFKYLGTWQLDDTAEERVVGAAVELLCGL